MKYKIYVVKTFFRINYYLLNEVFVNFNLQALCIRKKKQKTKKQKAFRSTNRENLKKKKKGQSLHKNIYFNVLRLTTLILFT